MTCFFPRAYNILPKKLQRSLQEVLYWANRIASSNEVTLNSTYFWEYTKMKYTFIQDLEL